MNSNLNEVLHDRLWAGLIFLYGVDAVLAFRAFCTRSNLNLIRLLIGLTFALHTVTLVFHYWSTGQAPLFRLSDSLLTLAWVLMLNFIIADYYLEIRTYAAFLLPVVFAFLLYAVSLPEFSVAGHGLFASYELAIHITFALMGNSAFALASIASIMYLIQEKQLRNKVFSMLYRRLPSLEELDRISHPLVIVGFPLFSLAILIGLARARALWLDPTLDGKVVWTILTWAVYAAYLISRSWPGWRGRKSAWTALAGFMTVLWNMFIVNILLTRNHLF